MSPLLRRLFHVSGALHLLRRVHAGGARILMYHGFPAEQRACLEQQMAHLRRYYRPTSLTELATRLRRGAEPLPHTVVVTVDDGYRDFYQVAYPVFRKYRIPALLFLATGFIDRNCWLWGDRVAWYLRNHPARIAPMKEELKALEPATRDARLLELEQASGSALPREIPPQFAPCSWDEIREMAGHGIEFGAHTVHHPILSRMADPVQLRYELVESKRRIEHELQRPCEHFAYPNGLWRDLNADAVRIARLHFETAVTAEPGWNHLHTDRHQLHRLAASPQMELGAFARRLAGAEAGVRRGRQPYTTRLDPGPSAAP